jgi:hypothetical protein
LGQPSRREIDAGFSIHVPKLYVVTVLACWKRFMTAITPVDICPTVWSESIASSLEGSIDVYTRRHRGAREPLYGIRRNVDYGIATPDSLAKS